MFKLRYAVWVISTIILIVFGVLAVQDSNKKAEKKDIGTNDTKIGGSFSLTDQSGNLISDKDFLGKNTLILFGFSKCPHICPAQLSMLKESLDSIQDLQAIFITLDPQNDTVERLADFHKNFHSRIFMLTGEQEMINKLVNDYKVYVSPDNNPEKFNHSAIIYLMGKKGEYIAHFTPGDGEELLEELKKYIR